MLRDPETNKVMTELDALKKSIQTVLTTPIGSRILLPEYGCKLFDLIDRPLTPASLYYHVTDTLTRWVPSLKINKINVSRVQENGELTLSIDGSLKENSVQFEVSL